MSTRSSRKTGWSRLVAALAVGMFALGATSAPSEAAGASSTQQPLVQAQSQAATAGQFPFSVALRTNATSPPFCSGSLVHPDWVLTAAHCVVRDTADTNLTPSKAEPQGYDPDALRTAASFQMAVGAADAGATGVEVRTARATNGIVVAPGYWAGNPRNDNVDWDRDLALIRLSSSSSRMPVELASPHRMTEWNLWPVNTVATVLGYGRTCDQAPCTSGTTATTNRLRFGGVTIDSRPGRTNDAAATTDDSTDVVCRGDSGGPWLVTHPDGTLRQFGISSRVNRANDNSDGCGDDAWATTVGTTPNHDWIAQTLYPDGMGRWLRRPISSATGTIVDPWVSSAWRTGWSIQEFANIGGVPHVLLYRDDDGTFRVHPVDADGTPSSFLAREHNWTEGWTSIRPYTIGTRTFLFLMKATDGTVVIFEMTRNASTGKVTLTERFRSDWSSGWTTAEPFTSGTRTGVFLLKESTGQVVVHELRSSAPYIDTSVRAFSSDWSSGWSHARFFSTSSAATAYLFLMKDTTGEVHIHRMSDLRVGTRYQDENVGARWSNVEFHRTSVRTYLTLQSRYDGGTRLFAMHETPQSNRMLGTLVQRHNAKDGNTQAKPFCVGWSYRHTAMACPSGRLFIWYYREGRV